MNESSKLLGTTLTVIYEISVWARNYYDEIIYGYGQPEILSLVLTLRLIPSKLRSSNGSKRLSRFEYK